MVWQTKAVIGNTENIVPLIRVQQDIPRGGTEIFIHMPDASHLFASITCCLDQLNLTVVDARIITSDTGYTFNTYIVLEHGGESIIGQVRIDEIISRIKQTLSQDAFDGQHVKRRDPRQLKHFNTPTQIRFLQDKNNKYTTMEMITADRSGLLSTIGQALMKCNINLQNAKIATLGECVEDVFFITDENNQPLCDEDLLNKLSQTIIGYLDQDVPSTP